MLTKADCKHDPWSRRPEFSPGQRLHAQHLNDGFGDELKRQRLLLRALHGEGVVFGFDLSVDSKGKLITKHGCIEVGCGLALDRHGRMLYWSGGRVAMDDLAGEAPDCEGEFTLCVHYAERRYPPDGCGPCDTGQAQWMEQSVLFSLIKGCCPVDRCCEEHPHDECISHNDYLCQRTGASSGAIPAGEHLDLACEQAGQLCRSECGGWFYDTDVCIPIACVDICDLTDAKPRKPTREDHPDRKNEDKRQQAKSYHPEQPEDDCEEERPEPPHCDPEYGFCPCKPDTCSVRPYVYRTPLLYDLINCCDVDLPRVCDISWRDWVEAGWNQRVDWSDFEDRITAEDGNGFIIRFSKPVLISTLHPGSVFLTALIQERRADYWIAQRIPMKEIRPIDRQDDCAMAIELVPDPDWIQAEVTGRRSTLFNGVRLEFTLRGQIVRDKCGQMLDARPLDISSCARCQERPGDDFITVFRIAPKEGCEDFDPYPEEKYPDHDNEEQKEQAK